MRLGMVRTAAGEPSVMIGMARGLLRLRESAAGRVADGYERLARRPFPRLRPRPLWYEQPLYYKGNPATFIGDGDTVRWPAYAQALDYELEIGVVIARDGQDLTPEEALSVVGGFVLLNDAADQMHYATTVAQRLPETFAALAAGRIHPVHLRIIEDETRVLSDQDAAKADKVLAEAAPGQTIGEARSAAHKLVRQLDPEAAKKRKEAARGEAHVRRFREASGDAGMVARELPSDEVLASWQHMEQRALAPRAAGMPGTLQDLRVRAYLDLLQERDSRDLPADPAPDGRAPEADSRPGARCDLDHTVPWDQGGITCECDLAPLCKR